MGREDAGKAGERGRETRAGRRTGKAVFGIRRVSGALAVLSLCGLLAGCEMQGLPGTEDTVPDTGPAKEEIQMPETQTPEINYVPGRPDTKNQLWILTDTVSIWSEAVSEWEGPGFREGGVAVTDLDGNGRLEIVFSWNGGSDNVSWWDIWEVNETFDGIRRCEELETEDWSRNPDIMGQKQPITVYRKPEEERLYYIFDSVERDGISLIYRNRQAVSLHGGGLERTAMAYFWIEFGDEDTSEEEYTDSAGNEISKEEYDTIDADWFEGYDRYQAYIGWNMIRRDWTGISPEERLVILEESWNGFSVTGISFDK